MSDYHPLSHSASSSSLQSTSCISLSSVVHFIRGTIALTGGVISWLSLWYVLETEILATSLYRNILFMISGIFLMILTKSLGGQAGLGRIFFQPTQSSRGLFGLLDSLLVSLCDQTVETQEIQEILRRKQEQPWETNIRIIIKYFTSLIAFGSGVLYWVGSYVLIDQYAWPDNPLYKHYSLMSVGLLGMALCGSLSIESGIWGENDVTAESKLAVGFYFIRCLFSLFFQVVYWIGIDHLFEQDLAPPTIWRHLAYLLGGYFLVSLVNTAGGMSGADEVSDENSTEEEEKRFQMEIEKQFKLRAKSIAAATEKEKQVKIQDSEQQIDIMRHSVEGYFVTTELNQSINDSDFPSFNQTPPILQSSSSVFQPKNSESEPETIGWRVRLYRLIRLILSLFGGILLWEGFESSIITHRIFHYANDDSDSSNYGNSTDSGDAPQIDDGTAAHYNTVWKLLVMLFAGWAALIITGTFYANAGVVGPLNVSRGRSAAYREQHRMNIARVLSSFRTGPESDLKVSQIEAQIRSRRGSLNFSIVSQQSSSGVNLEDLAHGEL
jgi:hypothetical protein